MFIEYKSGTMMKYMCCVALMFFLLISKSSFSQNIFPNTNNLREIKVDQLSDDDILKYLRQLKAMGITQQQAEQIAISKGMPVSEVQKLRQRIQKLNATTPTRPQ